MQALEAQTAQLSELSRAVQALAAAAEHSAAACAMTLEAISAQIEQEQDDATMTLDGRRVL